MPFCRPLAESINVSQTGYRKALEKYFFQYPPYGNALEKSFIKIGWEASSILFDWKELQEQWKKENLKDSRTFLKKKSVLYNQIIQFRPDLIIMQGVCPLHFSEIKELKRGIKPTPIFMIHAGFHLQKDHIRGVDLVLSASPALHQNHQSNGIKSRLLYHYDQNNISRNCPLKQRKINKRKIQFVFCGTSGSSSSGLGHHINRYQFLKKLAEKTPLQLYVHEPHDGVFKWSTNNPLVLAKKTVKALFLLLPKKFHKFIAGSSCIPKRVKELSYNIVYFGAKKVRFFIRPTKPLAELFPSKVFTPVFGIQYYNVLRKSQILLNKHTQEAGQSVGNMRMFEGASSGCVLLNDNGQNIKDLFEPGKEILIYDSIKTVLDVLKNSANFPEKLKKIGENARRRVITTHSAENRRNKILKLFTEISNGTI